MENVTEEAEERCIGGERMYRDEIKQKREKKNNVMETGGGKPNVDMEADEKIK